MLNNFLISFPSFEEQIKISSFLHILKKRIELQKKILYNCEQQQKYFSNLLFKYKKGN
ncbi:hypothetical protein [Candidatus Phytoplasma luffae]|uniref:hypothetical protein n=1 Tax=Loofah witches'-broom phytoplasma TaxID=35773 RepID=UPI001B36F113|nr:hypothetical protein [Candidatus Phytoplasma luffae]